MNKKNKQPRRDSGKNRGKKTLGRINKNGNVINKLKSKKEGKT